MREYKTERNFSQILSKITLDDVKAAIVRAEIITKQRRLEGAPIKTANGKPELLIQILYTYFSRKDLLDDYFSHFK